MPAKPPRKKSTKVAPDSAGGAPKPKRRGYTTSEKVTLDDVGSSAMQVGPGAVKCVLPDSQRL